MNIPLMQRRHPLYRAVLGGQPHLGLARMIGRCRSDYLHSAGKGPSQDLVQGRWLDGDDTIRAPREPPRPRPVPASDVEHRAASRASQFTEPLNLRLESPVRNAYDPHQQSLRQMDAQTRRDRQRAEPPSR